MLDNQDFQARNDPSELGLYHQQLKCNAACYISCENNYIKNQEEL